MSKVVYGQSLFLDFQVQMNDDETEYSFLITRASEYKKVGETLPSTNTSTPVRHPKKLPKGNAVYMKCRDHCPIIRASKKTDV